MGSSLLGMARLGGEVALEGIDKGAVALEVDGGRTALQETASCVLEIGEGCSPFPQHERSLPNTRSYVKPAFTKNFPFGPANAIVPSRAKRKTICFNARLPAKAGRRSFLPPPT